MLSYYSRRRANGVNSTRASLSPAGLQDRSCPSILCSCSRWCRREVSSVHRADLSVFNRRNQNIKLRKKVWQISLHSLPEFMKINVAIAVSQDNANGFDF